MYEFLLGMWQMKRIDESKLYTYVEKKFIDQTEAEAILATPQKE